MGRCPRRPWAGETPGPHPTDRGKSGVTRSVLTEGQGVPRGLVGEGAQRHDRKWVRPTSASRVVDRPEPTAERAQGRCLDAGDDDEEGSTMVQECGFTARVRPRGEAAQAIKHEAGFQARRWVVERAHAWMNRVRRLLVRWDQTPENSLALRHFACGFACGLLAFRAAGLFG